MKSFRDYLDMCSEEMFDIGKDEFLFYKGDVYLKSDSGDTHVKPFQGKFTWLDSAKDIKEAKNIAKVWVAQK